MQLVDTFTSETPNTIPAGYVSAQYANLAPAQYVISNASGANQMTEPSTGQSNDVLYYPVSTPMANLRESYSFVYSSGGTVPEPYLVYAPVASGGPLEGLRVRLTSAVTPTNGANNVAGDVIHQYYSAGVPQSYTLSRLRTEPYHYLSGHTYRVEIFADATTNTLTARIFDTAYGAQIFDQTVNMTNAISVYPGIINPGGAISINDFSFGPARNYPIVPHGARRAADYMNYLGYNASVTSSTTTGPTSQAILTYFPALLIKHVRITMDATTYPTQNLLAPYGINANLLTTKSDTCATIASFINNLTATNPVDSIEMANEPNDVNPDPNLNTDMPEQVATFRSCYPNANIWGPSLLTTNNEPTGEASMAPVVQPTAAVPQPSPIAYYLTAWNTHSYTQSPENLGFGGFFGGCGTVGLDYPNEDCGDYGATNWNDNDSAVLDVTGDLPGVSTEGAGSFGSYYGICGYPNSDNATQQAYVERGMLYNWKIGHLRIYPYKFLDDGGCSDGFGTYGIMNRIRYNDGTVANFNPKPAYTSLVYFDNLINDFGTSSAIAALTSTPLSYSLIGASPDVEDVLLEESDGSYRIILWSDSALWNYNSTPPAEYPIVSDSITLNLASSATVTDYTQAPMTGQWTQGSTFTGTQLAVTVNQYPQVIDVIPNASSATPEPLPTGVPTPGAIETPATAAPTPLPTSTSASYSDNFDSDAVGSVPSNFQTSTTVAPFSVFAQSGTNTSPNAFGENTTTNENLNASTSQYDMAWYPGDYAYNVEEELTFIANSTTTAPVNMLFPTTNVQTRFLVKSNGTFFYQYNSSGVVTYSEAGTLGGNRTSFTLGHVYGWKTLITNATGSSVSTFAIKFWDITAGAAEPAYGSSLSAAQRLAVTCGVVNSTTVTWSIDDFGCAYNGATLPAIGAFPSPTPTPTASPTPTANPTATPIPTPSPTATATPSPVPTPSPIGTVGADSFDTDTVGALPSTFSSNNSDFRVLSSATTGVQTDSLPNYLGTNSAGAATSDTVWYSAHYTTNQIEEEIAYVPVPGFSTSSNSNGLLAAIHGSGTNYITVDLYTGSVTYWGSPGGSGYASLGSITGGVNNTTSANYLPFTVYCAKVLFVSGSSYTVQMKAWPCGSTEPSYGSSLSINSSTYNLGSFTGGVRSNDQTSPYYTGFDNFAVYYDGAPASPIPTPVPTSALTPVPGPSVTNTPYAPAYGSYGAAQFTNTIFAKPLSSPSPDPSSSAWIAANEDSSGNITFGNFNFPAGTSGLPQDYSFPMYLAGSNGPGYYIHCTAAYYCPLEGQYVNLTANMLPEDTSAAGPCTSDCHMAIINYTMNGALGEMDMFGVNWPPVANVLNIGNGGFSPYSGAGYTSGSTAAGNALSQGALRSNDLEYAITNNTVVPYALQVAVSCDIGTKVAPFSGASDGHCTGGPPEGARFYCNLSDSAINAMTSIPAMGRAILRSLDYQHYGGVITDTDGESNGTWQIAYQSDLTYEGPNGLAAGTGPGATVIVPEAKNEGISVSGTSGSGLYTFAVPVPGSTLAGCLQIALVGSQQ